jgi:hypothetical protein
LDYLKGITELIPPDLLFDTLFTTFFLVDLLAIASIVTTLPLWTIYFLTLGPGPARLFCKVEVRLVL